MYTIGVGLRSVKNYVAVNKRLYLISFLVFIVGLVAGIVLVATGQMDDVVYTSLEVGLSDIIVNDYSGFSLFFAGLLRVLVPIFIIFVMLLNKYTSFLAVLYFGYQSLLLGASTASLILTSGLAGILNALLVVLPINFINFFLIASALVIFYKRSKLAKFQKITLAHSLKIFLPKLVYLLVGVVASALIYGFLYPLLLRSMIIINN